MNGIPQTEDDNSSDFDSISDISSLGSYIEQYAIKPEETKKEKSPKIRSSKRKSIVGPDGTEIIQSRRKSTARRKKTSADSSDSQTKDAFTKQQSTREIKKQMLKGLNERVLGIDDNMFENTELSEHKSEVIEIQQPSPVLSIRAPSPKINLLGSSRVSPLPESVTAAVQSSAPVHNTTTTTNTTLSNNIAGISLDNNSNNLIINDNSGVSDSLSRNSSNFDNMSATSSGVRNAIPSAVSERRRIAAAARATRGTLQATTTTVRKSIPNSSNDHNTTATTTTTTNDSTSNDKAAIDASIALAQASPFTARSLIQENNATTLVDTTPSLAITDKKTNNHNENTNKTQANTSKKPNLAKGKSSKSRRFHTENSSSDDESDESAYYSSSNDSHNSNTDRKKQKQLNKNKEKKKKNSKDSQSKNKTHKNNREVIEKDKDNSGGTKKKGAGRSGGTDSLSSPEYTPPSSSGAGASSNSKKINKLADHNRGGAHIATATNPVPAPAPALSQRGISFNRKNKELFCKMIKSTTYLNAIRIAHGTIPKVLCASADSTVQIFNINDGSQLPSLVGHTDRVISLAVSNPFMYADKHSSGISSKPALKTLVASGSRDEQLRIWDMDSCRCLHSIHAHKSPIWAVAIAVRPNGDVIVLSTAEDGSMRSWNGKTGKKINNFKGHTDKILSVYIMNPLSETPLILSAGCDKKIRVWELLTGSHIRMLEGHSDEINSVVASSFSGVASLVPIGQADDSNQNAVMPGTDPNRATVIVSGSKDLTVRVWDFKTGHLLFELLGHTSCVYEVALIRTRENTQSTSQQQQQAAIPPGTPVIISCSEDSTVKLWNLTTGKLIKSQKWHNVSVRGIDVANIMLQQSNNNTTSSSSSSAITTLIASCGWDKTIQFHELNDALYTKTNNLCTIM